MDEKFFNACKSLYKGRKYYSYGLSYDDFLKIAESQRNQDWPKNKPKNKPKTNDRFSRSIIVDDIHKE